MITLAVLEQSSGLWKNQNFFYTKLGLKFTIKKNFLSGYICYNKQILSTRKMIILAILEQSSGFSKK